MADKRIAIRRGRHGYPPLRALIGRLRRGRKKKLYGKTVIGVIRSTFVIGADGRVEVAQYNVKATGHVAKLRKELEV